MSCHPTEEKEIECCQKITDLEDILKNQYYVAHMYTNWAFFVFMDYSMCADLFLILLKLQE